MPTGLADIILRALNGTAIPEETKAAQDALKRRAWDESYEAAMRLKEVTALASQSQEPSGFVDRLFQTETRVKLQALEKQARASADFNVFDPDGSREKERAEKERVLKLKAQQESELYQQVLHHLQVAVKKQQKGGR